MSKKKKTKTEVVDGRVVKLVDKLWQMLPTDDSVPLFFVEDTDGVLKEAAVLDIEFWLKPAKPEEKEAALALIESMVKYCQDHGITSEVIVLSIKPLLLGTPSMSADKLVALSDTMKQPENMIVTLLLNGMLMAYHEGNMARMSAWGNALRSTALAVNFTTTLDITPGVGFHATMAMGTAMFLNKVAEAERKAERTDTVMKDIKKTMKKCSCANKYKGVKPPRCNNGDPCEACKLKYGTKK